MKQIVLISLFIVLTSTLSQGAVPNTINFQGMLTDTAGAPLGDGNYNTLFMVYNVPAGGAPLWSEVQSVGLIDGLFSVILGDVNAFSDTLFNTSPRYLAIQVGANPELTPRTMLLSVPWSMQSNRAESAIHANSSDTAAFASTSDTAIYALASPSAGGSIFTRWGNNTAPAGTELIYSGYVYGSNFSHAGPNNYIVVHPGNPGESMGGAILSLLYPAETETSGPLVATIPTNYKVKAAVCYCDAPTLTIWGTDTPPTGWTTLYTGYAMGPHYNQVGGPVGPICVDNLNFQPDTFGNNGGAPLYPITTETSGFTVDATLHNRLVKCVVCKKN